MRAVTISEGRLEWTEHPDPVPGDGEVLVRVKAAGLNAADILQRAGGYPAPPGSPKDIPGLEFAGEVLAVGPKVFRFKVGDRVMAITGGGGQAELALAHERTVLRVPDSVEWPEAGGFPEAFTTAHDALFTQCDLAMGERLCVHGAAGGVGVAAVQLGAVVGASVVGTVRNPDLREAVGALGAEVVAPESFGERGPFDVVLELIGAPNMAANLKALRSKGRICVIGIGAGEAAEVSLFQLMLRRARISGSMLRDRPLEDKAAATRAVESQVLPLLASGRLQVPVARTFPMSDAQAAYEHFVAGGKLGKIVLVA